MTHPKHIYALVEILKNNRIGQSMVFNGHRSPEEVKENIDTFKFERDNAGKICIIAVVPLDRLNLPENASQESHAICTLNLIKKEEIYYLGDPIDKNNKPTKDPSKIAGVRIGRYIQADFKPGDYIIHPQTGEIFGHFGTARSLVRHQRGNQLQRLNVPQSRGHDRTAK